MIYDKKFAKVGKLNQRLKSLILERKKANPHWRLRYGGWSSKKDFQWWGDEAAFKLVAKFLKRLRKVTGEDAWEINAWANVLEQGDSVKSHDHILNGQPNVWSGVYFVTSGSPIVFPKISLNANPGLLLVFRSGTIHSVETHEFEEPRISVAFNARRL